MKSGFYMVLFALGCLVLFAIGYWLNLPGMHDLAKGLQEALGQLWQVFILGISILFFCLLFVGSALAYVELKKRDREVRPGKHGYAQAVYHKGELIQLASPTQVQMDPMQQMAYAQKLLQFAKYAQAPQVQEVEEDSPRLALPSPVISECINLSGDYQVPADDFLSGRKLIVGMSGTGKSNSVGVYAEELGRLEVPLILADTEDEYQPLCDSRWFPNGLLASAQNVTVGNCAQFGRYVLEERKQVILNLQSYEMEEAAQIMIGIIGGMREWEEERDNSQRIPCEFILEEAVTWLPQNIKESPLYGSDTLNMLQSTFFNDMVRKGRKRGLGLTVVCQKIAEIDKRALQADARILHYQNEGPDLACYKKIGIESEEALSLLKGDAYLYTSRVSKRRVHVRRRESPHGANTPGLEQLRASERGRNFSETAERQGSIVESFNPPVEPFQNISTFRTSERKAVSNPYEGIPETLVSEIEARYEARGRKGRTALRDEMDMNGDQYWMIRVVCDEYDKKVLRQAEEA